ncbi:MAG TPA: hypothetical protein DDW52_29255 [Planctomycetaceae bacterium]|nr:hypothetical protein [Planctomycetaceae bacterium]
MSIEKAWSLTPKKTAGERLAADVMPQNADPLNHLSGNGYCSAPSVCSLNELTQPSEVLFRWQRCLWRACSNRGA